MSDRRPENLYKCEITPTYDEAYDPPEFFGNVISYPEATFDEVLAFVRRGVESGTIKGEVVKLCRTHEGGIKTVGLTDERCHRRFGSVIPCEFDEGLVIPLSNGGSET